MILSVVCQSKSSKCFDYDQLSNNSIFYSAPALSLHGKIEYASFRKKG